MKEKSNEKNSGPDFYGITAKDGSVFDIPAKGSMGLLALGYRGLMAWREKRNAEAMKKIQKKSECK